MTQTKMLIGSLSNDLYRVACLAQRGSQKSAQRFLTESSRWTNDLRGQPVQTYIHKILDQLILEKQSRPIDMAMAERLLMFSIQLQNYALHMEE